jgi:hypothetical protein
MQTLLPILAVACVFPYLAVCGKVLKLKLIALPAGRLVHTNNIVMSVLHVACSHALQFMEMFEGQVSCVACQPQMMSPSASL